ncbi:hydroxysteroid 11-beta-dehydrogenase 1-like protein [Anneissia japonica]|uniref:hydroxysteroid 11-beta-dehydrogenase 1-like protein n=1 Tax=Anneissia japonica TaxID=1529436 RepID=UPI0014259E1C|nr:hydroxysteroid 11-beta-dehydrogenase 1-like protein [Anneissia japonica]
MLTLISKWKIPIIIVTMATLVTFWSRDTFDPETIKGKRVLITGASSGIGEAVAYKFCSMGAKVLVTARRESRLQQVMKQCRKLGAESAYYMPLDMSIPNNTRHLVNEAVQRFGGIDYLILNHIISYSFEFWEGDFDYLERTMTVNFGAYVALATFATPVLEKSKGRIVVVSSLSGKVPLPRVAAYSASKFAVNGFFGALRQEHQMKGIDVSVTLCIIGPVATESAITSSTGVIDKRIFFTSTSETADKIVEAGALRWREIHYPKSLTIFPVLLRDIAPWFTEWCTTLSHIRS